jgi:hypothetical protein
MLAKGTLRIYKLFIVASFTALALGPYVRAGGYRCNCEPSIAVYHSPFFGYYRTCWRPWPGGQPLCPSYAIVQAGEPTSRRGTAERTLEQLPPPRPEEPEVK